MARLKQELTELEMWDKKAVKALVTTCQQEAVFYAARIIRGHLRYIDPHRKLAMTYWRTMTKPLFIAHCRSADSRTARNYPLPYSELIVRHDNIIPFFSRFPCGPNSCLRRSGRWRCGIKKRSRHLSQLVNRRLYFTQQESFAGTFRYIDPHHKLVMTLLEDHD